VNSLRGASRAGGVSPAASPDGMGLPAEYGVTRLVLMPRDTEWIHAYWEVAPYTWREAERIYGRGELSLSRAVLRFYTGGNTGPERRLDIGVEASSRRWYVNLLTRPGPWRAELGLVFPDGRFALLAVSNQVSMPAGRVWPETGESMTILKGEQENLEEETRSVHERMTTSSFRRGWDSKIKKPPVFVFRLRGGRDIPLPTSPRRFFGVPAGPSRPTVRDYVRL
jgi:hypothetical protein